MALPANSSPRSAPPPPAAVPASNQGTTLPLNTPRPVAVPQLPGGGSWPVAGPVTDPGGTSLAVGQVQTVGMPTDQATPGGGSTAATGGYVPGPTQGTAQWSQANISGNPNPGALSGSPATAAPSYLPGQTAINQQSPQANPNPGAL